MRPPFDSLVDAYGGDVLRFLVAAVGPQEAEDCFQETFAAALDAYRRLSHTSNLKAWLLRIAQRKAIDSHRERHRRSRCRPLPAVPLPPLPGEELGVWDAVRVLPPKQRAAVTHRFANDLSYRELAVVLQCSEDAARRNVHEGLKKLREVFKR